MYLNFKIFKELNGIFAFAIYENNKLTIVRDHVGVKPLFYYFDGSQFVFSSEIKGIFAYGITPRLNKSSWCEIIGLGPAHTPGNGVFENIHEVLSGHYLTINLTPDKKIILEDYCYWKLRSKIHKDDYNATVMHTNFLIEDSIKIKWFLIYLFVLFCQVAWTPA